MTKLLSYDENRFPDLTKTQITGIHSCALYFVTTGRNAWHSTWVQQYTNGCMHSSIASAKQYTEKLSFHNQTAAEYLFDNGFRNTLRHTNQLLVASLRLLT